MTAIEWLTALATAVGLVIGLTTLGGLLVRYALLPWLQVHIVTPVKETNQQVTVNGHVSKEPTLLDKVDTLQRHVASTQDDLKTAARMFEGHIERSGGEWTRLWAAIKQLDERTQHHD